MIVVVGCGISGLSCAAVLADRGHRVEIWAARRPPHTTSNVAAAFWYPYRADPPARALGWASATLAWFRGLAADRRTGVATIWAFDLARGPLTRPWWADAVPSLRAATPAELPAGYRFGWAFETSVIDTRTYLPWLMNAVETAQVTIRERALTSLDEALGVADVVVNCTGLGAGTLVPDASVFPIRGQLVHVSNPGIDRIWLDESGEHITYIVPRGNDCVLGGTTDAHDHELRARPEDAARIRERAQTLDGRLGTATHLADVVGLRPGRSQVRLEAVSRARPGRANEHGLVVHNYGHGGAGATLSWGRALEVADLIAAHTPPRGRTVAQPS